jgi:hypothetical protein
MGNKDGKGIGSNDNSNASSGGQELDCALDMDGPPLSPLATAQLQQGLWASEARSTKRVMATVMRTVINDMGGGDSNKGGGRVIAMRDKVINVICSFLPSVLLISLL